MSETQPDLREALARAVHREADDGSVWALMPDEHRECWRQSADRIRAQFLAPILAQVSALQAEVERLQKVEGEREKGRVPDGTGLSPKGEADKSSSSQSDFDPSREAESICHEEQLNIWSGEIVDCLSMGDYLRDDLSYDETLMIHAEAGDQIRSIIESAFDLLRKSRR